ncbi:hypothetical protein NQ315_006148 [Exocentrus adspersus]|uniref:HTH psq-type domain-containing protein n=1 Tax=Exocentrus adspersus TaxID=1586481 RepID=A0AAV8VCZ6_9CUCU|nr:hypothetical protein NQ315_006148 [Exocentrus adspersus]
MPRLYKRKPGSRNYRNYTQENLEMMCLSAIKEGCLSQRKAAEQFKIPRRTILNKLKKRYTGKPGHLKIFSDEEEMFFVQCILKFSDFGFPLDSFDLRMIIKSYLTRTGRSVRIYKNNVPGKEWLTSFLRKHSELTMRFASNIKRVRAGITSQVLKDYINNLSEVLTVSLLKIFGTGSNLTDNPGQKKVIVKRGTKYPEKIRNTSKGRFYNADNEDIQNIFLSRHSKDFKNRTGPKSSISVMFAGSAASELFSPYTVYKSSCLWTT